MKLRLSPNFAAFCAVVIVLAIVGILDRLERDNFQQDNRATVLNQLSAVRAKLESELNKRLFLARGLVAYVSTHPEITPAEFENLGRVLLAKKTGIYSVSLVQGTVITAVYPRQGNEKAIGVDLSKVPQQQKAVERVIQNRRPIMAGPVNLIQGGIGLIDRAPVFITPPGEPPESGDYWGMVSLVINQETILQAAGILDTQAQLRYALRGRDGLGAAGEVFFGDAAIFQQNPILLDVSLPSGTWQLAAVPAQGWVVSPARSKWLWLGGGFVASLTGILVFKLLRDPVRLREAVTNATVALSRSEAKYRELVESANTIILQLDHQGKIIFFNEFAQKFFGYSEAEIFGKSALGTIVPMTDSAGRDMAQMLQDCIQYPERYEHNENENIRRTGEKIWISWRNKPLLDAAGKFAGILCIGTDISDRKRAEELLQQANDQLEKRVEERTGELQRTLGMLRKEISDRQQAETELRESEERWQLAVRGNNDGIWDWNLKTNEVFYSGRWKEMLGYKEHEIINHPDEWQRRIHPDDLNPTLKVLYAHLGRKTPYYVVEYRMQCQDGRYKWILSRGQALWDEAEKPVRIVGSHTDIHDHKQAEEALRESEAREREKAEQLAQTLRQLQRTQTQLIQTEKMSSLGQLVAGIAHEINNPVTFIHGNLNYVNEYAQDLLKLVDLYQQECPHPSALIENQIASMELDFIQRDLFKILNSMQVGTERIRSIVLSLRNFSRLDESFMKPVDIHEGIESTLLILQTRLKGAGDRPEIQVVKEFGNLPAVECYAGQLNQVFFNLLSNAIDALEEQMLAVNKEVQERSELSIPQISIRTSLRESTCVSIEIADNGPGMNEAVKQRIFDLFFTTKPVGKGTGLGLSISYQIIVEKHGGHLQCISEIGQGTKFDLEIPIRQRQ